MVLTTYKKYLVLFLLACLLCLMFFSARWGIANIYAYQTIQQLQAWQEQAPKTISETNSAMQTIRKARKLDANNPDLMSYQAQVFEWQARLSQDKNSAQPYLASAAELYRGALVIRPTWPFDWVALADLKAELNEFDDEFSKAIERSNSLGAWEYPVQLRLVNTGFKHWQHLTSKEQDIINQSFDRALRGNRFMPFIKIASKYQQLALFCARSFDGKTHTPVIEYYACKHQW